MAVPKAPSLEEVLRVAVPDVYFVAVHTDFVVIADDVSAKIQSEVEVRRSSG